ncbi:MAG: presqualene diphosphate synthase HpnD [Candidatus Kapabacteria bacterium]|nr:presqualene diphosphate synthase HpnD [Candidatus Kapabacteria bacterium]
MNDALPLPRYNTTNFFYSFSLLPKEEREAIHTVYAFCRYTDDIVDMDTPCLSGAGTLSDYSSLQRKRERLERWRREVERCYNGTSSHPIMKPLSAVVQRFSIPQQYLQILIDGCERDLIQQRYRTFEELKEYCYSVASIVGLISIEIFGYKYDETKEYAVNLGYALQLTNILRDIKSDKDKGRIYLPQEDLERFQYSEDELLRNVYNDNFVEMMKFQTRRVREYYHKARAALRPDESITMFAAQIMDAIYYRLLDKIEIAGYNVFSKRISVSTLHKLLIALRLWVKSRLLTAA